MARSGPVGIVIGGLKEEDRRRENKVPPSKSIAIDIVRKATILPRWRGWAPSKVSQSVGAALPHSVHQARTMTNPGAYISNLGPQARMRLKSWYEVVCQLLSASAT